MGTSSPWLWPPAMAAAGLSLALAASVTGAAEGPPAAAPVASDHIVVQLATGVRPAGRAELGLAGSDAVLRKWGALEITPALRLAPDNAALAAQTGLDRFYRVRVAPMSDARALAAELRS